MLEQTLKTWISQNKLTKAKVRVRERNNGINEMYILEFLTGEKGDYTDDDTLRVLIEDVRNDEFNIMLEMNKTRHLETWTRVVKIALSVLEKENIPIETSEDNIYDVFDSYRQCSPSTSIPIHSINSFGFTQFTISKTDMSLYETCVKLNKCQQIDNCDNKHIHQLTLVLTRNSLIETEQWRNRAGSYHKKCTILDSTINVVELSSKSTNATSKNDVLDLLKTPTDVKDLPNIIMMCSNSFRARDVIDISKGFLYGQDRLHPDTGKKTISISLIFDEAIKSIAVIDTVLSSGIVKMSDNRDPSIVNSILYMTATPEDPKLNKLLDKHNIERLKNMSGNQLERRGISLEDAIKSYRSISDHNFIPLNDDIKDPVEYVSRNVLPLLKKKGGKQIVFAPATVRISSHEEMSRLFMDNGYNVLIHNSVSKELRLAFSDKIINIEKYKTIHSIQGSLCDVMRHLHTRYTGNLAITGNYNILIGATLNTDNFNFTDAIFSYCHTKDPSDMQQAFGRCTGHKDFCKQMDFYTTYKAMSRYMTITENKKVIFLSNPKYIEKGMFKCIKKEDFLAYTKPLVFPVPVDIQKSIFKEEDKVARKKNVCKFLSGYEYFDDSYNFNTCVQCTMPETHTSYKKQVTNLVKLADKNEASCISITKKHKYNIKNKTDEFPHQKGWIAILDNIDHRIIAVRWDASKL
jgi:hypothetical protein